MDRQYQSSVGSLPPITPFPGIYGYTQGLASLPQFGPTNPGAFWFYYITESIRNVVVAAGLTPDPSNLSQFAQALELIANQ